MSAEKTCVVCGKRIALSMAQVCFTCMEEVCEAEEAFGVDELEAYADHLRRRREIDNHGKVNR